LIKEVGMVFPSFSCANFLVNYQETSESIARDSAEQHPFLDNFFLKGFRRLPDDVVDKMLSSE
jgi:hypothetical protein